MREGLSDIAENAARARLVKKGVGEPAPVRRDGAILAEPSMLFRIGERASILRRAGDPSGEIHDDTAQTQRRFRHDHGDAEFYRLSGTPAGRARIRLTGGPVEKLFGTAVFVRLALGLSGPMPAL